MSWRSRTGTAALPVGKPGWTCIAVLAVRDPMPIWTSRRETARKTRGYISAVMQWAISMGYRTDNPARDVVAALPKAGRTVTHQRALPWRDVQAALGTIEASDAAEVTKLGVRFLVLTATRSGEVRGARWAEVELGTATWTIPASRMKSAREHRVPLSPEGMAVLERAREFTGDSGLVFPSRTGRVLSDATISKLSGRTESQRHRTA